MVGEGSDAAGGSGKGENPSESISVAVRLRPLLQRERKEDATPCVSTESSSVVVASRGDDTAQSFKADQCFPPTASQEQVFEECGVKQLLQGVVSGISGTLFAYGQTGSGKTYTVFGEQGNEGLFPRAVRHLFEQLPNGGNQSAPGSAFTLVCSAYEIYNEEIYDLLAPSNKRKPLQIREHFLQRPTSRALQRLASHRVQQQEERAKTAKLALRSGHAQRAATPSIAEEGFHVEGCTEQRCTTASEVIGVVNTALQGRRVGSHDMNERSSRSHCMVTLRIQSREPLAQGSAEAQASEVISGVQWTSRLTLVDLAGSERLKETKSEGTTLKEGQHINRSLFALGQVISTIHKRNRMVHSRAQLQEEMRRLRKERKAQRESRRQLHAFMSDSDLYGSMLPSRSATKKQRPATTAAMKRRKGKKKALPVVQFRSSKLTMLLANCLGGHSKAVMIACLTPSSTAANESLRTLRFAMGVKRIKNKPVVVMDEQEKLVASLRAEISKLREDKAVLETSLQSLLTRGPSGHSSAPLLAPLEEDKGYVSSASSASSAASAASAASGPSYPAPGPLHKATPPDVRPAPGTAAAVDASTPRSGNGSTNSPEMRFPRPESRDADAGADSAGPQRLVLSRETTGSSDGLSTAATANSQPLRPLSRPSMKVLFRASDADEGLAMSTALRANGGAASPSTRRRQREFFTSSVFSDRRGFPVSKPQRRPQRRKARKGGGAGGAAGATPLSQRMFRASRTKELVSDSTLRLAEVYASTIEKHDNAAPARQGKPFSLSPLRGRQQREQENTAAAAGHVRKRTGIASTGGGKVHQRKGSRGGRTIVANPSSLLQARRNRSAAEAAPPSMDVASPSTAALWHSPPKGPREATTTATDDEYSHALSDIFGSSYTRALGGAASLTQQPAEAWNSPNSSSSKGSRSPSPIALYRRAFASEGYSSAEVEEKGKGLPEALATPEALRLGRSTRRRRALEGADDDKRRKELGTAPPRAPPASPGADASVIEGAARKNRAGGVAVGPYQLSAQAAFRFRLQHQQRSPC